MTRGRHRRGLLERTGRSALAVLAVAALIGLLLFLVPGAGHHSGSPAVVAGSTPPPAALTAGSAPAPPPSGATAPAPAPGSAAATAPPAQHLAVTVLNNSRVTGAAARAAAMLRAGGWPVALVGDLHGRIAATTAYYPPGGRAAALALARQFPWITRVLPRLAGLPGHGLTLVLTKESGPAA